MAPERLNTQQIHRQDLSYHLFMREADLIAGIRLPEQARVLKQPGVHGLEGGDKRGAVGGAGEDHHHKSAAEDPDNHFADARLCNIPQLGGIEHIHHREGNNGGGIARQLESVGDVVGEMGAGPGTASQPCRHAQQEQPWVVQSVAGDN